MKVKEVKAKSVLNKSGLPGLEYSLNPYKGCGHACIYCYAPSVLREKRKWGSFVEVKTNAPEILEKEASRKSKGLVGIGTVTDPYQPIEKKYKITRKCLEVLLKYGWPISIQTKSSLVLRDIDLIKKFRDKEIGFTIITTDDSARKRFEPGASPIKERFRALKELKKKGIKTWVFIGPIMPEVSDVENIIKKAKELGAGWIMIDKLRLRPGLGHLKELVKSYDWEKEKKKIFRIAKEHKIRCLSAF
ncbi:MAG: radical SAM protein [Candidatus Aenigmatarchaeota archaeon]